MSADLAAASCKDWSVRVAALLLGCLGLASTPAVAADTPTADTSDDDQASSPLLELEDGKRECLKHHEQAQILRRAGSLRETRTELLSCSRQACPDAIRADCVDWIEQVNRGLPTVVITAHALGRDVVEARVFVDGVLALERLTGKAIDINPGEHRFRFESPPWPAVERTVLLSEGVKERAIDVEFAPAPQGAPDIAAVPLPKSSHVVVPAMSAHRAHALDYALGGVAFVGLSTFAVAGTWALIQRHDLKQSCAPFCSGQDVDSVRAKLLVADLGLGFAVASLAVLSFRWSWSLGHRDAVTARAPTYSLTARTLERGAAVDLWGRF